MFRQLSIILFVSFFFPTLCWGQEDNAAFNDSIDRTAPDFVIASLMIAAPGDVLYSLVGHACIRLECPAFDLDYCFSYESEDVKEKVLTFIAGGLRQGMFARPFDEYVNEFAKERRGVRQYKMNLPIGVKRKLWEILDKKCAEGANLPYDYLERGCAQATLQMLLQALGETDVKLGEWPHKYEQTRRELVGSHLQNNPWTWCFLYLLAGSEADRDVDKIEKVVIPTDLVEFLEEAKIEDVPIINGDYVEIVPSVSQKGSTRFTPLLLASLLFILSFINIFVKNRNIDWFLLGIETVIGLFLTYLILLSDLPCTEWNWLIIPFNPLPALLWKWRKYWALCFAIILIIWAVVMISCPHKLIDLSYVVFIVALIVMYIGQSLKFRLNKLIGKN